MKLMLLAIAAAGALLTTGCGPTLSLHPLYTNKDLVADLPLEGIWTDVDAREVWEVKKSADGFEVRSGGDKLDLRLVRLGEYRFLDVTCRDEPSLAIPGHVVAKVWMEGEELCAQAMDTDWLKQKVRQTGFPHVTLSAGKQIILTAPTDALRKFVLLYANEPNAFEETTRFHRVR
jgi:hypothetical protein